MPPQAANAIHASQTVRYTMPIDGLAPGSTPVISRDGRQIAIVGSKPGGSSAIWVLSLDGERPKELPGTSGAASPFWSPDGRSLGFFADGAIRRVDLSGGPVQRIARAEETLGGAWSSSGTIVFSERYALFQVPASGGTPALVASLDLSRQENSLRLPEFLPDGRHFLYLARSGRPDNSGAYLASIDGGAPKRILNTRWPVRYVSPDTLMFVRDDILLAQSFDIERGTLSGTPRQIVGPIDPNLPTSDFYGASDTGTLVYRLLPPQVSQLAWVARDGAMGSALGQPTNVSNFRISPEERRIVFDEADRGSRSVGTLTIGTGGRSRLRFQVWITGSRFGRPTAFASCLAPTVTARSTCIPNLQMGEATIRSSWCRQFRRDPVTGRRTDVLFSTRRIHRRRRRICTRVKRRATRYPSLLRQRLRASSMYAFQGTGGGSAT